MKLNKTTKSTLFYGLLAILAVWVCMQVADIKQRANRPPYPGSGVYDLSTYAPCTAFGEAVTGEIHSVGFDFKTNSQQIQVTNDGEQEITVYLSPKESRDFGSVLSTLPPRKKVSFTNLTAAREYRIGVESSNGDYTISITD